MSDEQKAEWLIYSATSRSRLPCWRAAKIVKETQKQYQITDAWTANGSVRAIPKGRRCIVGFASQKEAAAAADRLNAKLRGADKHYRDRCGQILDDARKEAEGVE